MIAHVKPAGLIVAVSIALLSLLPAAQARQRPARARGTDARIAGSFAMVARVTAAVGVPGERTGERLDRRWSIVPERCPILGNVCRRLILERQRSDHVEERVVLRRVGRGRYAGTGSFYVALGCNGRVYQHGSLARFRITLRVTSTVRVQRELFARGVRATYDNPLRTDDTPCPLGPSHDAATYTGRATSPVPQPPVAAFTESVNAVESTASFTDQSKPGSGGARIVVQRWFFADPNSGSADSSSKPDPKHRFSAPGTYDVILVVLDANGLYGEVSQAVTVPPATPVPPPASLAAAP